MVNLLRMSAAPLKHLMLLNGYSHDYSRARLFELAKFKVSGRSVRTRQTSVFISWAPFLNARRRSYARELDITSGKSKCTETLQQVLIELLWNTVLSKYTANEARSQGHTFCSVSAHYFSYKKNIFDKEISEKLINWWNQSKSEVSTIKKAWIHDIKNSPEWN